ncbi:hypothetical protein D3C81_714890 [compost metagenome]
MFRLIRIIVCTMMLGTITWSSATAEGTPTVNGTLIQSPVLLKINQYYVLFTAPSVPYIDEQRRLMIPLRAVSELLGTHVVYLPVERTASITKGNNQVEVTLGSTEIKYTHAEGTAIDTSHAILDTKPVLKQGQIFIPAKALLDGLHLKAIYEDSLLSISVNDLADTNSILGSLDSIGGLEYKGQLRPTSFSMNLPPAGSNDKSIHLTMTVKNISGQNLAAGSDSDLWTGIATIGGVGFDGAVPKGKTIRPALAAGESYEAERYMNSAERSLKYIVVEQ